MQFENLLIDKKGNVFTITINRPKFLNAINTQMLNELEEAIDYLSKDDETFVVVITGEGKAFVAGADISEMNNLSPQSAAKFVELGDRIFRKIEMLDKPVIAAINGFALGGGCELAMSCDIRIASDKAKFGQPETGLGIIPGFSGTQRLSRLVGIAKAKELIYTSNIIDAMEAERILLVNKVVPHEELMSYVMEMANTIKSKSQVAVKYAKVAINRGIETDIETAIEIEKNLFSLCFASQDQKEGMQAFLEKRKPNFSNK